MFIKDPATADSLGASASVLNTLTPTFARLTSAWDPANNAIVYPSTQRTRSQTVGTTSYTMTLLERIGTNGLAAGTSERFDRWTAANGLTVAAGTTAAPDGDVIAQTLTDPGASLSSAQQVLAITSSANTIPISIYVKKTSGGTAPTFGFTAALTGGTPVSVVARINTDTGAQQYGSNAFTTVVNASTDYWRVILLLVDNASGNTTLTIDVYPAAAAYGASVDDATATGSAICTFAMKENASGASTTASTYVSNRNVLSNSQTFGTTWGTTRASITSDSTANPITSAVDADTLVEDGTAANTHFTGQNFTKAASAIQMTFSVYIKQSGNTWAYVQCSDSAITNGAGIYFDVANGVKGTAVALGVGWTLDSSNITAVGSWYRCDITVTTSTATSIRSEVYSATADLLAIHNGSSAAALILWGGQLVYGAVPMNYWANTTTVGQRVAETLLSTATFSTTAATFILIGRPQNWSTTTQVYNLITSSTTAADLQIGRSSATDVLFTRVDGGGTQGPTITYTGFASGANSTLGMTYDATAVTGYVNGVNSGSDTSLTPAYVAVPSVGVGYNAPVGSGAFGGYVLGFYWTTVLPPSSMQIFANGVAP